MCSSNTRSSRASDILMRITVHNRGPEAADLHVLPQLWFRNTWSWGHPSRKPELTLDERALCSRNRMALGTYRLYRDRTHRGCSRRTRPTLNACSVRRTLAATSKTRFTSTSSTATMPRSTQGVAEPKPRRIIDSPSRLARRPWFDSASRRTGHAAPFKGFDRLFDRRRREADEFYADLQQGLTDEQRLVQRQALAGMIWSKQFYLLDVPQWLEGDPAQPPPPAERARGRNHDWEHLNNADIISMPDKWEYPWYAAWDLAFHMIPLALIDPDFAKHQLVLLTREWYMHPNGQLPAYEWNFGDVNPPVHALGRWRVFQIDRKRRRLTQPDDPGDLEFLERVFHKLMLNFTWWVNRKDAAGTEHLPGRLPRPGQHRRLRPQQAAADRRLHRPIGRHRWMAMYCAQPHADRPRTRPAQSRLSGRRRPSSSSTSSTSPPPWPTSATTGIGLWDEEDGFYLRRAEPAGRPDAAAQGAVDGRADAAVCRRNARPGALLRPVPEFKGRLDWFLDNRPDLAGLVSRWNEPGLGDRRLLSLLRGSRMKKLLQRMLDETEFLSTTASARCRSHHREHPYHVPRWNDERFFGDYVPGESTSGMFGGNSNWRGPIWLPMNYLIIESLQKFHHYYGDEFKVECPTGSGRYQTIDEIASDLSARLAGIFLRNERGERPVFGSNRLLQDDPHFRDHVLFHEYFHGDSGRGVGASHQTGWTGLIAKLLQPRHRAAERTEKNTEAEHGSPLAIAR